MIGRACKPHLRRADNLREEDNGSQTLNLACRRTQLSLRLLWPLSRGPRREALVGLTEHASERPLACDPVILRQLLNNRIYYADSSPRRICFQEDEG